MLMRKVKHIIVGILIIGICFQVPIYGEDGTATDGERLENLMTFITENYYGDSDGVSKEELFNGALNGIFNALDPYSAITKLSDGDFLSSLESSYVGIGAYLMKGDKGIRIESVIEGSPAQKAKLQAGDEIIKVNGLDINGYSTDQAAVLIKGEEGSSVTLTIQNVGGTKEVVLVRQRITINSAVEKDLKSLVPKINQGILDKTCYVSITSVSENTNVQLLPIIEKARKAGKSYMILDLRNNGGGYLNVAIDICRELTKEGTILTMEKKDGTQYSFTSSLKAVPFKLIVLVNSATASAAEIISGAIQKSGSGIIIGQQTYGKGVAQSIYYFEDTYQIKLTDQRFLFRDGSVIQGIGLTPDYQIIHTKGELTTGDRELLKAIEIIGKSQY